MSEVPQEPIGVLLQAAWDIELQSVVSQEAITLISELCKSRMEKALKGLVTTPEEDLALKLSNLILDGKGRTTR